MSTRNDLLKNTFSNVINDYEYSRPKYLQELYEKISMFVGSVMNSDGQIPMMQTDM